MSAHFKRENRQRQRQSNPEPTRHVGKLGIGSRIRAYCFRFEGHAADRAEARTGLANFGMHRARVDRAFDHRRRNAAFEILARICLEF